MLIDGKLVDADSGSTFENVNPATEEVLGTVADASAAEMERAIDAARRAFHSTDWPTNRDLRKQCLAQLQAALEAEKEAFRAELIAEVGCPVMTTLGPQLDGPVGSAIRWPMEHMDAFPWVEELPDTDHAMGAGSTRQLMREPAGVVGAITPWNFPLEVILNKVGQALATGNTMVLKPAPDTPFNATRLAKLVAEQTDIPAGVFNVVTSSDHLVGEELTLSPKVDLISFTGSTVVGRRIMSKGGETIKRLFLELGGKSATIVLEDAPLDQAVMMGMAACFHAGQGCAIQTRMLLPRSRYDEGVEMLSTFFAGVPYGDPTRDDVMMGPVISDKQRRRILGYIEKGVEEGATLAVGGKVPGAHPKGWFLEPTLFTNVDNSMTIAQEENFGPVLVVIPFDDEEDAIRIANDSPYGLSGGVWSASVDHGLSVASRIRTGNVGVNGGMSMGPDVPFGGYKHSGVGRQNGFAGLHQYVGTKALAFPKA